MVYRRQAGIHRLLDGCRVDAKHRQRRQRVLVQQAPVRQRDAVMDVEAVVQVVVFRLTAPKADHQTAFSSTSRIALAAVFTPSPLIQ